MTSTNELIDMVRRDLNDRDAPFQHRIVGDGVEMRFQVPFNPIVGDVVVTKRYDDQTVVVDDSEYFMDDQEGFINFVNPPEDGAVLVISGFAVHYFDDVDLGQFVETAVLQHCHGRTTEWGDPMTAATIPPVEVYPVSIQATILALWAMATDLAFDIDVYAPEGVTIPRHQRYQQVIDIIAQRTEQYKELAAALNIGLIRAENFMVRRVSRRTGRYVPIYQNREIEDSRSPKRIFFEEVLYGGTPDPSTTPRREDLLLLSQHDFTVSFEDLGDLTDLDIRARVRPFHDSIGIISTFVVVVDDLIAGNVTLTLTTQQTYRIPRRCFWDLQVLDAAGNLSTLIEGDVFAERQSGF